MNGKYKPNTECGRNFLFPFAHNTQMDIYLGKIFSILLMFPLPSRFEDPPTKVDVRNIT